MTAQSASRPALIAWDRALLTPLPSLEIKVELYKRCVDDLTKGTRANMWSNFDSYTKTMLAKTEH